MSHVAPDIASTRYVWISKVIKMVKYYSSKKYGHERGLSAAFRQWKADSHCKYIHGYSLEFEFKFGANELDEKNWVVDFGGLKELEKWLRDHFDHKTLVASDDPELEKFRDLDNDGIIQMVIVESTGAEMFAKMAMEYSTGTGIRHTI